MSGEGGEGSKARVALPTAQVRSQRPVLITYAVLAGLLALSIGGMMLLPDLRVMALIYAAVLGGPLLGLMGWSAKRLPPSDGAVEADAEGLWVGGKLAVPTSQIKRAVVAESGGKVTVSVTRSAGFYVVVDVASVAEGEALVRALGHDATQARSEFKIDSPISSALSWAIFLAFLAVGGGAFVLLMVENEIALGVAGFAVWFGILLAMAMPARVVVGLDGLLVQWLWRRRLVRFSDVTSITEYPEGVRVTTSGGGTIELSTRWAGYNFRSGRADFDSPEAYQKAVERRITQAWQASRASAALAASPLRAETLLRNGRELRDWVGELRGRLARGADGFRAEAAAPEQLWATIEDSRAEPEVRAGAAAALSPSLDEAGKERLRVAAGVVASPRLRVALEAAAEGDDERLLEALGEIEGKQARA